MADDVKLIRSVGVVGQGGVGKTSLADALLFAAGAVTRLGRVDDGSSNFDFEPEETRRKITLSTAFYSLPWKKHDLTIVDTPGYANFLLDTLNCMRACTGLVFVLAPAANELRVEAEKIWARAEELHLPVIGFVSRMDRERADFQAAVDDVKKVLGANPVPIHYPIGAAEQFRGVVDLIAMRAWMLQADGSAKEEAIPDDVKAEAESARERMVESAAEATDELTEKYLENGTLSNDEVVQALREGTLARRFVPVLCGSAARPGSVQPLLDAAIEYLSSAAELGTLHGQDPKIKEPIERRAEVERGVFRVCLQDHRRSLCRQALHLPRAVRQGRGRLHRAERQQGQPRAAGTPLQVGGQEASAGAARDSGRDRRRRQAQGHRQRRYPGGRKGSDSLSGFGAVTAGDLVRGGTQDQGR